jgi:multidrug efflux pump subunit AcrA (membrane-fusion protein)
MIVGAVVLGVLVLVRVAATLARSGPTGAASGTPEVSPSLMAVPQPVLAAHGVVQPIARANVATLGGGTVNELAATVGQVVEKGQILVRIAGSSQTELVVAPWRGTVSSVAVHAGDSVLPGAAVMTIADLSRYQVETTDVDEYLIGRIRVGQAVTMMPDALAPRTLHGTVASISPQSQPAPGGGAHYRTIIEMSGAAPGLWPGMSVHIVFDE